MVLEKLEPAVKALGSGTTITTEGDITLTGFLQSVKTPYLNRIKEASIDNNTITIIFEE